MLSGKVIGISVRELELSQLVIFAVVTEETTLLYCNLLSNKNQ